MPIHVAPLPMKPPRLSGLSQQLIDNHYELEYGQAVRRYNEVEQRLRSLSTGAVAPFELNALKREQLLAAGSVGLHELYFDSLGGDGRLTDDALLRSIERDFESFDS